MLPCETHLGQAYQRCDKEGNYLGCFAPMYAFYPDTPRYPLPLNKGGFFDFAYQKLLETFNVVHFDDLSEGDILVFEL